MAPRLTRALERLRADINTRFPKRDKASDGWIGDAAHQARVSGHNPDDTPGSRAEYGDADTVAEVRAVDVDADLREAGTSSQALVDAILRWPADRNRFRYIIHKGHIWRKNGGWQRETYTGSDPHTGHIHFSGDPDYDDSSSPFRSVLDYGKVTDVAVADDVWNSDRIVRYDEHGNEIGGSNPTMQADYALGYAVRMAGMAERNSRETNTRLEELAEQVGRLSELVEGALGGGGQTTTPGMGGPAEG